MFKRKFDTITTSWYVDVSDLVIYFSYSLISRALCEVVRGDLCIFEVSALWLGSRILSPGSLFWQRPNSSNIIFWFAAPTHMYKIAISLLDFFNPGSITDTIKSFLSFWQRTIQKRKFADSKENYFLTPIIHYLEQINYSSFYWK